ncbi:MAG: hypothetical protein WCA46_24500 [Actinocatenispora sp.]
MSTLRHVRTGAAVVVAGAAAVVGLASAPAQAGTVHPDTATNCTYGHNGNVMTATCTDTADGQWYLDLTCMRYAGSRIYHAKGTLVFGSGTSQASCGAVGEPLDSEIVNLV